MRRWPLHSPRLILGLQAVATVLYVLGQLGQFLPQPDLDLVRPFDSLVRSGNEAVSVILATVGFVLTRRLLEERARGWRAPVPAATAILGVVVMLLAMVCLAALVVFAVDDSDTTSRSVTWTSIRHVMTFDWNFYLSERPLSSRPDLSALWLFAVLVQLGAAALALVVVLGTRPVLFAVACGAIVVASVLWLAVTGDDLGWYRSSLSTVGRADEFALGMLAASVSRRIRLAPETAASIGGGTALCLLGSVLASSFLGSGDAQDWLVVVGLLAALYCLAADQNPAAVSSFAQWSLPRRLVPAAAAWFVVVAWAPIVIRTAARRGAEEHAWFVALGATLILAVLTRATVAVAAGASRVAGRLSRGSRERLWRGAGKPGA